MKDNKYSAFDFETANDLIINFNSENFTIAIKTKNDDIEKFSYVDINNLDMNILDNGQTGYIQFYLHYKRPNNLITIGFKVDDFDEMADLYQFIQEKIIKERLNS